MKKVLVFLTFIALLGMPDFVSAAAAITEIGSQSELGSLQEVVSVIYKVLIVFFPGVAIFYLILSGYRYIIAQGNQDLTEKAKKSLTYAVFGIIISFGSVAIINLVAGYLGYKT